MRAAKKNVWTGLEEALDSPGIQDDKNFYRLVGEMVEKTERQNSRLIKLEEQMSVARVTLAEVEGYIDKVKADMDGEIKLVYQMLSRLSEKIERIEANTSKEQNVKRTWRIALIAALPGVASVIIKLAEVISGS